jgi:tripartite-type tricarboxylate transporter receptor subunit TctC
VKGGAAVRNLRAVVLAATVLLGGGPVPSEAYPDKPIRLVVPYTPGGGADILARIVADKLNESASWRIVVDNRPGAGGNIGADIVAKSPSDGYTLLFGHAGPLVVNPHLYRKLPYDPIIDFNGVALIGSTYNFLVVHPQVPAASVKDLIALAKRRAEDMSYASAGVGSGSYLAAELFKGMAHIQMTHIPYKGNAPALMDVLGGQVPVMFPSVVTATAYIKAGRLKVLGVTTAKRLPETPNVPTIAETLPGYEASIWYGVVAPAGTPAAIVKTLNEAIRSVLQPPDVRKRLVQQGVELATGSGTDFDKFIKAEYAKWGRVVRTSGLQID